MLLHLTFNGKKTSVLLDDTLMDLVGAVAVQHRPEWHADAERQHKEGRALARRAAKKISPILLRAHKETLTRVLTRTLLLYVASDELLDIVEKRGPRYDAAKARKEELNRLFSTPAERAAAEAWAARAITAAKLPGP